MFKTSLITILFALSCIGCNKPTPAPEPLTEAELPAVMEKTFASAAPDSKALASEVVGKVKSQDYSKAFFAIQNLAAKPGLSKEQVNVSSRAMLTINKLLQDAQAKGDAQAIKTMENYSRNK